MPVSTINKIRIRKGDVVSILSGRDRGKSGKVLEIDSRKGRVFVEKINIIKRHTKPGQKQRQGGIIEKEAPVNLSNVQILCQSCGKPTRIGIKTIDDGSRLRVCKKCNEVMDEKK